MPITPIHLRIGSEGEQAKCRRNRATAARAQQQAARRRRTEGHAPPRDSEEVLDGIPILIRVDIMRMLHRVHPDADWRGWRGVSAADPMRIFEGIGKAYSQQSAPSAPSISALCSSGGLLPPLPLLSITCTHAPSFHLPAPHHPLLFNDETHCTSSPHRGDKPRDARTHAAAGYSLDDDVADERQHNADPARGAIALISIRPAVSGV